ncbi:MAG TPA: VWA domain-containing protein [Gemmatimonadetes bacterium]|nr:VWA domain-containing protein [Gemmatimonadota bacterium]
MYRFEDPLFLVLLMALPALVYVHARRSRLGSGAIRYSDVESIKRSDVRHTGRRRHGLFVLRIIALAALVVAFSRPQTGVSSETVRTAGIDIVLAIDVSSSMLAEDLDPNRLEAAKAVAAEFVESRLNDRIGLVVFAGDAFTQVPLTLDHSVVIELLAQMEVGMIEDGTAVGMGLATAVKRLQASDAESQVVVLLTDGRNNTGEIGPVTAGQMAQALGVRVYTVGAGGEGLARIPIDDRLRGRRYAQVEVDIDDESLREVAETTGGQYFRATDREGLGAVYEEIDALETTEIEVQNFTSYGELFHYPLSAGLLLLLLEVGLGQTVFRKLP